MADDLSTFEFYKYQPSMAAAVIFIILFSLSTLLHLWQLIRTKTWYFIPFVLGGIFEIIGYIGRAASATQTPNWTLGPYIIQTLFLLIAPALFTASIYIILGRIILVTEGEAHSLVRRTWLTKIFVSIDVLSFFTQSAGGGIMAKSSSSSSQNLGQKLVIAGLFIQVVGFSAFFLVALIFHVRMINAPTGRVKKSDHTTPIPWRKHIYTLYVASILILIRSIFRIIEYIQGFDGYILKHEIFLYIFDAALMFGVVLVFVFIHPSEIKALLIGGNMTRQGQFWRMKTVHTVNISTGTRPLV